MYFANVFSVAYWNKVTLSNFEKLKKKSFVSVISTSLMRLYLVWVSSDTKDTHLLKRGSRATQVSQETVTQVVKLKLTFCRRNWCCVCVCVYESVCVCGSCVKAAIWLIILRRHQLKRNILFCGRKTIGKKSKRGSGRWCQCMLAGIPPMLPPHQTEAETRTDTLHNEVTAICMYMAPSVNAKVTGSG